MMKKLSVQEFLGDMHNFVYAMNDAQDHIPAWLYDVIKKIIDNDLVEDVINIHPSQMLKAIKLLIKAGGKDRKLGIRILAEDGVYAFMEQDEPKPPAYKASSKYLNEVWNVVSSLEQDELETIWLGEHTVSVFSGIYQRKGRQRARFIWNSIEAANLETQAQIFARDCAVSLLAQQGHEAAIVEKIKNFPPYYQIPIVVVLQNEGIAETLTELDKTIKELAGKLGLPKTGLYPDIYPYFGHHPKPPGLD